MIYIITILIVLLIICSLLNRHINIKRQIRLNEMEIIYEKMEQFVYKNELQNDSFVTAFLKPYKNYVVNTGFADIQILIALFMNVLRQNGVEDLKKKKEKYDKLLNHIPKDLKEMSVEFNKKLGRVISLSVFRADFLLYIVSLLIKVTLKSIFHKSRKAFTNFVLSVKFASKPDYDSLVVSDNRLLIPSY